MRSPANQRYDWKIVTHHTSFGINISSVCDLKISNLSTRLDTPMLCQTGHVKLVCGTLWHIPKIVQAATKTIGDTSVKNMIVLYAVLETY
jgi:hypothetical protein